MSVGYFDFVTEAKNSLQPDSPSEMACRCSISRAYYGLYHAALAYADSISLPPVSDMGGRTHEKLRVFYQGSFHSNNSVRIKHRKIGYALKQLHDQRVMADYLLDLSVCRVMAESHLQRCADLVDEVIQLESTSAA